MLGSDTDAGIAAGCVSSVGTVAGCGGPREEEVPSALVVVLEENEGEDPRGDSKDALRTVVEVGSVISATTGLLLLNESSVPEEKPARVGAEVSLAAFMPLICV